MPINFSLSQPDANAGSSVKSPVLELPASEILLDAATGDVALPIQIIRGGPAVAQRVKSRFKFFLGEWFLDTRQGVPYFQQILVQRPSLPLINNIFRQVLVTTPGVRSVSFFSSSLDRLRRQLAVNFEAKLTDGSTLTFTNEPFIVGNQ